MSFEEQLKNWCNDIGKEFDPPLTVEDLKTRTNLLSIPRRAGKERFIKELHKNNAKARFVRKILNSSATLSHDMLRSYVDIHPTHMQNMDMVVNT